MQEMWQGIFRRVLFYKGTTRQFFVQNARQSTPTKWGGEPCQRRFVFRRPAGYRRQTFRRPKGHRRKNRNRFFLSYRKNQEEAPFVELVRLPCDASRQTGVNWFLAGLLELVSLPQNNHPPQYSGVPRRGRGLGEGKLRRTLRAISKKKGRRPAGYRRFPLVCLCALVGTLQKKCKKHFFCWP